jgi:hypothetical protein
MYEAGGFCFTGETANPHGTTLLHMVKVLDIGSFDREASLS